MKIPTNAPGFKTLSLITGALLLTSSFSAHAGDVGVCGPDQRCSLIGKFKPGLITGDGQNGAGNYHTIVFDDGIWTYNNQELATFGMGSWTPILGDWDGDGYDEPGVYSNGLFVLKHQWEGLFSPISPVYFGAPDATPVIGDWNGDGYASIGTYKDGTFELVVDYNNPVADHIISFGTLAPAKKAQPIVGALGQAEDVVGLMVSDSIQYAPVNVSATYDFYSFNDPGLEIGDLVVPGGIQPDDLQPVVVSADADGFDLQDRSGVVLGLVYPPGSDGDNGFPCYNITSCYFLNFPNDGYYRPDTEGGVVIPGDPFSDN